MLLEDGNKNDKLLSIILLSYYSENNIDKCYKNISKMLKKENIPYEFIIIDDGSLDNSYLIAQKLEKESNNVKAFQLSKNFTSHYSIFAGLSVCNGACAMPIVDDEQQPYSSIVDMYRLWEIGEKVIIPHRSTRKDPVISKTFSMAFYWIMNKFSDVTYPSGGADLFFIDREIINILNDKIHPIRTSTISEVLRLGFSPYYLPYDRPLGINEKKSRWSLRKKIQLAKDTFFSSSSIPIRFISQLGIFFSCTSFIIIIFYLYISIWGNNNFWKINVPGWTSIILFISFFSGIILLSLGIIAQYIYLIYEEVKDRPGFIIKEKNDSNENK